MLMPTAVSRWKAVAGAQFRANIAELATYFLGFVCLVVLLIGADAFDAIYDWSRAHEAWEADEIILAGISAGLVGFVFVVRRWRIEYLDKQQIQSLSDDLRQALRAARAADEAKSAFLANLSHELRTPINAINGYAQLMEMGIMGPIDARYAGYAKDIRESGEHLLSLINDILDLTRATTGSVRLHRENLDLSALTIRCFKLVALRAGESGVTLSNLVPAGFPAVNADPQRLGQILLNLLGNAIKFSPSGSEVQVAATTKGTTVRIEVRDRGIGMNPKDAVRAVEPFVQIEAGLEKNHDGAGLGLALVKRFVELHGGTLAFDTAPGRGTTVIVTLPDAVARAGSQREMAG